VARLLHRSRVQQPITPLRRGGWEWHSLEAVRVKMLSRKLAATACTMPVAAALLFAGPLHGGGQPTPALASVAAASTSTALEPAVTTLRADLDGILGNAGLRGSRWSVMVVSLDRGDTLYAHGADESLAPASNMKLYTTAAALYYLGPEYRFSTYLVANGPIRDGVLDGDVLLYGTGDPTFSGRFGGAAAAFQAFADTLVALGIREVRGAIVGDASYFSGSGAADGWQDSYMNAGYAAPANALSYAENIATLQIRPGAQPGWRPEVRIVPGGDGVAIVNQATTSARGGGTSIQALRTAYDGPIVVRGRIAAGSSPVVRTVPLADSHRYAAAVLREAMQQRGIVVHGGVGAIQHAEDSPVTGQSVFAPAYDNGATPLRVLAVHTSRPLLDVLDVVNRRSHNLLAEQTLRLVGRVAFGEGSIEAGGRAIRYMLECETGLSDFDLHVADGSGLSVLNRSSARTFIQLLDVMARSAEWEAYWSTLPEAGRPNGLRRMHRTDAELNLRAKTGTINNVSSLSGYVRATNGERLAFAIIANQVGSTWQAKRVEDAIGARIASFDRPVHEAPVPGEPIIDVAPVEPAPAAEPAQPAPPPAAPDPTPVEPAEPRTYTIRSGDTLDAIARRHGITVAALQRANPGVEPRRLRPGQTIRLP
jgi:serine-type D-Ala-D-Ala carboxypeptidase/endopeptidase (penicillin-binding protein 4)